MTFLSLIDALGKPYTFWLYALLCVIALLYVYYSMPETKGLSLEEIEVRWRSGKHARDTGK